MMQAEALSDRERRCLEGVARGKTTKEIARSLGVSHRTVEHHVAHAMQKLGARTRTAAVVEAYVRGEIELRDPRRPSPRLVDAGKAEVSAGRVLARRLR